MKRKHVGDRVLPADWTEVIGNVQEVLTQAEREAGEREQILVGISIPSAHKAAEWKVGLEQFEECLRLFHSEVQQAEDHASEAELVLADGEKALEHWLARATDITRRVAKAQKICTHADEPML